MREWWAAGCPEGLSVRAWAVALPAWLLTWAALATVIEDASVILWILIGLSGFLSTGIAMLIGKALARPVRNTRRVATIVGIWIASGAIGLALALLLGVITELLPQRSSMLALLAAACFTCIWFPVGGRFASSVKADVRARSALLGQLARERALAIESARLVEADRRRLVQQTEEVVSEQLAKATGLSADPVAAVAALQAVVDEVVRPLSRELERDEVQEQALVEAVHTMGQVGAQGLPSFIHELRHPGALMLLSTLARIFVSLLIVVGLDEWRPVPTATWILFGAIAVYTIVASSLTVLAAARTAASERNLRFAVEAAEWASSRLRQLAWSERERLSRSIHGEAQAQIVAAALQIQLGQTDDIDGKVRALDRSIHALLSVEEPATDWRATMERILKVWDYSIEVRSRIDDDAAGQLDCDPVAARAVVSVLRESLTNAVRHGQARTIDIIVQRERLDLLRMDIVDDGSQVSAPGEPGIGTRTLDAACHEWCLNNSATGHRLTAWIPTSGGVTHG